MDAACLESRESTYARRPLSPGQCLPPVSRAAGIAGGPTAITAAACAFAYRIVRVGDLFQQYLQPRIHSGVRLRFRPLPVIRLAIIRLAFVLLLGFPAIRSLVVPLLGFLVVAVGAFAERRLKSTLTNGGCPSACVDTSDIVTATPTTRAMGAITLETQYMSNPLRLEREAPQVGEIHPPRRELCKNTNTSLQRVGDSHSDGFQLLTQNLVYNTQSFRLS